MSIRNELLAQHDAATIDDFDAWLDDEGEVIIATLRYAPSEVLRCTDPETYAQLFTAWLNSLGPKSEAS